VNFREFFLGHGHPATLTSHAVLRRKREREFKTTISSSLIFQVPIIYMHAFFQLSGSDFEKIPKAMEDEREIDLAKSSQVSGYLDEEGVELKRFRSCLKWVCLDQSNIWRTCISWSIFFLLTIGIPLVSHFALSCSTCDDNHSRPYHAVVQLSLSIFATLSFVCLSRWARQYSLRRFLFLDKLCDASEKVQRGYAEQLQVHFSSSLISFLPNISNINLASWSLIVCASFESIIQHIGPKGNNIVELRNPNYIAFSFKFD